MQVASDTSRLDPGIRRPLSRDALLLVLVVLFVCLASLDLAWHGPLTTGAVEYFLIRPAERHWGFHAEWKEFGSANDVYSLLTVVRVAQGGPFDRAGIKPGFAFAPRHSATGGPRFGGPYSVFEGGAASVRVRMLVDPNDRGHERRYDISR